MSRDVTLLNTRTITCANCQRERLTRDVFWHVEDECFYCQDVQACEYRYYIQGEREAHNQRALEPK